MRSRSCDGKKKRLMKNKINVLNWRLKLNINWINKNQEQLPIKNNLYVLFNISKLRIEFYRNMYAPMTHLTMKISQHMMQCIFTYHPTTTHHHTSIITHHHKKLFLEFKITTTINHSTVFHLNTNETAYFELCSGHNNIRHNSFLCIIPPPSPHHHTPTITHHPLP